MSYWCLFWCFLMHFTANRNLIIPHDMPKCAWQLIAGAETYCLISVYTANMKPSYGGKSLWWTLSWDFNCKPMQLAEMCQRANNYAQDNVHHPENRSLNYGASIFFLQHLNFCNLKREVPQMCWTFTVVPQEQACSYHGWRAHRPKFSGCLLPLGPQFWHVFCCCPVSMGWTHFWTIGLIYIGYKNHTWND